MTYTLSYDYYKCSYVSWKWNSHIRFFILGVFCKTFANNAFKLPNTYKKLQQHAKSGWYSSIPYEVITKKPIFCLSLETKYNWNIKNFLTKLFCVHLNYTYLHLVILGWISVTISSKADLKMSAKLPESVSVL